MVKIKIIGVHFNGLGQWKKKRKEEERDPGKNSQAITLINRTNNKGLWCVVALRVPPLSSSMNYMGACRALIDPRVAYIFKYIWLFVSSLLVVQMPFVSGWAIARAQNSHVSSKIFAEFKFLFLLFAWGDDNDIFVAICAIIMQLGVCWKCSQ